MKSSPRRGERFGRRGGELFARGLDNPRGLCFASDGWLYVAEGGRGGRSKNTDPETCEQVPPPIGPYTAGPPTGRVSRISPDGSRVETVAAGFPSSQTAVASGAMVSGVADVSFLEGQLYALIGGAGCSHGLEHTTNGVIRIDQSGASTPVADLSAFWRAHPATQEDPADREPDGTPFCMIASSDELYVVEAHSGIVDVIRGDGRISRLIDISESEGHIVPTALAELNGVLYLACLGRFPVRVGTAGLFRISFGGRVERLPVALTAVTGIAASDRRLYVVEATTTEGAGPKPGTGRIVSIDTASWERSVVATELSLPTGVAVGPDGMIYLANRSFGFPPGEGEILRFGLD